MLGGRRQTCFITLKKAVELDISLEKGGGTKPLKGSFYEAKL